MFLFPSPLGFLVQKENFKWGAKKIKALLKCQWVRYSTDSVLGSHSLHTHTIVSSEVSL